MNDHHGLTASNLMGSLPQVLLEDESMAALASSIAAVLEKRCGEIRTVAIYPRIDALPEELLDILAQDLKIDWWHQAYSLETKREILKRSWNTHRILGTKAAVVETMTALFDEFDVIEWFEYGGQPGYFKIETRSFQLIGELDRFIAALSAVKRLSAHLDRANIVTDSRHTVGVGAAHRVSFVCRSIMERTSVLEELQWYADEHGEILLDEDDKILID